MKAIEKMVEYLRHKEATSVLFQSVWQDAKLEALRLAAEEKAGDEGLRDSQTPSPAYLEENAKLWAEAVKAQQELYRENQRLQCEIDRLSRHPASEQKAPSADRTEELVKRLREFRDTISKLGYDDDTEDSLNRIIADLEKGAK